MIRNGITYYIKKVAKETRVSYDSPKMGEPKRIDCQEGEVKVVMLEEGEMRGCKEWSAGKCLLGRSNCERIEDGTTMMSLDAFDRRRRGVE